MRLTSSRAYTRPTPVPKMPTGLVELMEGLARDVLKNNPANVYEFCANHMEKLLEIRDGPFTKKLVTLDQKILKAQEKVRQRAKERQEKFDKQMKLQSIKSGEDNLAPNETDTNAIQETAVIPSLKAPIHHEQDLEHSSEVEISQIPQVSDTSKNEELNVIEEVPGITSANSRTDNKKNLAITTNKETTDDNIFKKLDKDEVHFETLKEFQPIEIFGQEEATQSHLQTITEASDENSVSESTMILPEITIDDEHGVRAHGNLVEEESVQDTKLTGTNDTNKEHSSEIRADSATENLSKSKGELEEVESNVVDAANESTILGTLGSDSEIIISNANNETDISNIEITEPLTDNKKLQHESDEAPEIINLGDTPTVTSEKKFDDDDQIPVTMELKNDVISNSTPASSDNLIDDSTSLLTASADVPSTGSLQSEQSHKVTNIAEQSNQKTIETENENNSSVNHKETHGDSAIKNLPNDESQSENKSKFIEKNNTDGTAIETKINDVMQVHKETLTEAKIETNQDESVPETNNSDEIKLANENALMTAKEDTEDESIKPEKAHEVKEGQYSHVSELDTATDRTKVSALDTVKVESDGIQQNVEIKEGNYENNHDSSEILLQKSDSTENTNEDSISIVESDLSKTDDDTQNNPNNMDLETAAVTIQKVFRSLMFNKNSTFEDNTNDENNSMDEDSESKKEEYYAAASLNKERRPLGITRMDTVLQTVNEEKSLSLSTDDSSTLSSAATTIQAHVRGFLVRNRLNSSKTFSMNSLVNSHEVLETDPEQQKNKTILNIHIVPEEGNYLSRDESLLTSMDLSLDGSPPSSVNLHPMSYDTTERRKMLKREDAVQSVTPPSNNSGKLSEDSVKEVSIHENGVLERESTDEKSIEIEDQSKDLDVVSTASTVTPTTIITISKSEEPLKSPREYTETALQRNGRSFTSSDESDVITPFASPRSSDKSSKLIHSGEFHDVVLPTKVSRNDASVVRGE